MDEGRQKSPKTAVDTDSLTSTRRGFLAGASTALMGCGLAAGYGTAAALAVRFLYPAGPQPRAWMFVVELARIKAGDAILFRTPEGASINVARQGESGDASDFVALSSVCPHLGCQVFWEAQNNRFFCPCHNGVFDAKGMGTEGPPKGQPLAQYPVKVENGMVFIEAPVGSAG